MAVGRAIDTSLAQFSHRYGAGMRPTATAIRRLAEEVLVEELRDADVAVAESERIAHLDRVAEVIRAFRASELFGLPRPRSRLVLINDDAGYYAQPDFWDARRRIYEMKSYRADPAAPEIALQLDLFQLAFPRFETLLARFDRHAPPVRGDLVPIPVPSRARGEEVLRVAYRCARERGQEKVLGFVDTTVVRYRIDAADPASVGGAT